MFRTFIKIVSNIKLVDDLKPLGRWEHQCDVSRHIKSALANHDCCGDKLCGDPSQVKIMIERERSNGKQDNST